MRADWFVVNGRSMWRELWLGAFLMRNLKLELYATTVACLLLACSGSKSKPVGSEGGACTQGGGCDPGLVCLARLCSWPPDSSIVPSAGGGGGAGAGADSGLQVGTGGVGGQSVLVGTGGVAGGPGAGGVAGGVGGRAAGGAPGGGGTATTGGAIGSGGRAAFDGGPDAPNAGSGGATGIGGTTVTAGTSGRGGAVGMGGATSTGGSVPSGNWPCDIYASDGGPCVAAHSTVRRLVGNYIGPLYQVRAGGSDSGTRGVLWDIGFLADGFADSSAQDTACGTDACTISVIYDQTGNGNHLTAAPAGEAKQTPGNEADAKKLPVVIGGHKVYGVHIGVGVAYRNNAVKGTATGDNPETIYMVASADYYNGGCCFDYGNVETSSTNNGEGAAEAVYFGSCIIWNKGAGAGPWIMGDLENGLWAGNTDPYDPNSSLPSTLKYVTGMVKGDAAGKDHWTIKVGNAQSGKLVTPFDGVRPTPRYDPMRKEGGITLGAAGDNTNAGVGNFFEGLMTAAYSSSAADDAVQANIVAVYGQ